MQAIFLKVINNNIKEVSQNLKYWFFFCFSYITVDYIEF